MEIVEFRPEREQYAFTFGGVAPVRKVAPGTMLRLWTEDAFCGGIRSTSDLPSTSLTMPFVNPQTGPFHVEGAAPGDPLALHFAGPPPARPQCLPARAADGPDAGHGRGGPGRRGGALLAAAGHVRREHGHPGNA